MTFVDKITEDTTHVVLKAASNIMKQIRKNGEVSKYRLFFKKKQIQTFVILLNSVINTCLVFCTDALSLILLVNYIKPQQQQKKINDV